MAGIMFYYVQNCYLNAAGKKQTLQHVVLLFVIKQLL